MWVQSQAHHLYSTQTRRNRIEFCPWMDDPHTFVVDRQPSVSISVDRSVVGIIFLGEQNGLVVHIHSSHSDANPPRDSYMFFVTAFLRLVPGRARGPFPNFGLSRSMPIVMTYFRRFLRPPVSEQNDHFEYLVLSRSSRSTEHCRTICVLLNNKHERFICLYVSITFRNFSEKPFVLFYEKLFVWLLRSTARATATIINRIRCDRRN